MPQISYPAVTYLKFFPRIHLLIPIMPQKCLCQPPLSHQVLLPELPGSRSWYLRVEPLWVKTGVSQLPGSRSSLAFSRNRRRQERHPHSSRSVLVMSLRKSHLSLETIPVNYLSSVLVHLSWLAQMFLSYNLKVMLVFNCLRHLFSF